jgi:nitroimidazol reductase NimA-like FMN-containing flavoprotein (pyridoxamine 5'-phosphate oxidase superfamily)
LKRDYDDPRFVNVVSGKGNAEAEVLAEIKALCHDQPFAVLATEGEGQPYTSLISFAVSEDLKKIVFSTPAGTRKFNLIANNNKVSVMIDNRSDQPESINLIRGLTITGQARVLKDPGEIEQWSRALTAKHNYLYKFVKSPTSSLILIEANHFFYVRRFQEVYQWIPGSPS